MTPTDRGSSFTGVDGRRSYIFSLGRLTPFLVFDDLGCRGVGWLSRLCCLRALALADGVVVCVIRMSSGAEV